MSGAYVAKWSWNPDHFSEAEKYALRLGLDDRYAVESIEQMASLPEAEEDRKKLAVFIGILFHKFRDD